MPKDIFDKEFGVGDWVVVTPKGADSIRIGEVVGIKPGSDRYQRPTLTVAVDFSYMKEHVERQVFYVTRKSYKYHPHQFLKVDPLN